MYTLCYLVWPSVVSIPLVLTYNTYAYKTIFEKEWYDIKPRSYNPLNLSYLQGDVAWPSPLGLGLGILAVAVGQAFMLFYFCLRRSGKLGRLVSVQKKGPRPYELMNGLATHLAQPEGFVMLGGYLIGSWMLGFMPASYYSFEGGINWQHVFLQLLSQDFIQYIMHLFEHNSHKRLYQVSHKPHHRFFNPRLFDAFNGSPTDTFLMILVPLFCTARLINANVWSYMAFGSLYANWLTLIHSEYHHPWDTLFTAIGFGTPADHHVHHAKFSYNFGHLFMYWDMLGGTYKNPRLVEDFNDWV